MSIDPTEAEIAAVQRELAELDELRLRLERRLQVLSRLKPERAATSVIKPAANEAPPSLAPVANSSPAMEKVALFRRLFGGRTDVFPARWENSKTGRSGYAPACANEWVRGVCGKPQIKCGDCPNKAFIAVTADVIECHLRGEDRVRSNGRGRDFVAGVYPLFFDDTCSFLAVDFDDDNWSIDALAFIAICREVGVPVALERTRSGNGGHVWLFFSEPVAAADARRLGTLLLTRTMNSRPEIGFKSYDRLFPSQDTMPSGGFGNLIAWPLQRRAREKGNSVFVDDDLQPHDDQWAYLSTLRRLSPAEVTGIIGKAEAEMPGGLIGVRLPVDDENADEPWKMTPSRRRQASAITEPVPEKIAVVLADQVYVDRNGLPSLLVAQLVRIAAFQNPEFYRAQAMRLPSFDKPRIISCAKLHPHHVGLPRGCLDEAIELLRSNGAKMEFKDERNVGKPLDVKFLGTLHDVQVAAVTAIEPTTMVCWLPRQHLAKLSSGQG
jgi:hypothetical protein